MANSIKEQQDILEKLNIHVLNPMQEEAIPVINNTTNTILLSPTGTGKTLAFCSLVNEPASYTLLSYQCGLIINAENNY
jgi:superfamily II DNA/RNA helicase